MAERHMTARHAAAAAAALLLVALAKPQAPSGVGYGRCLICHVDLVEQLQSGPHGAEGAKLKCETCHGESEGHVRDEHNDIKPDRLFGSDSEQEVAALVDLCGQCHQKMADDYREALGNLQEREPALPTCTGCHGSHKVAKVRFGHGK
jgi:hypothetical protein